MTLPRIGNSMEVHSISERDDNNNHSKKRSTKMGSKSVDQPRMGTIAIVDSIANEESGRVMKLNSTLRDSSEQTTSFDT